MHEGVRTMLDTYRCRSSEDYENALKEIIQEIALLGLWRAKFFEHAAFYGGSALRIVYDIDRFSENLDFSLLRRDVSLNLAPYLRAVRDELRAFGFEMTVEQRDKKDPSPIRSAFIKASTRLTMLSVNIPDPIVRRLHRNQALKIKLEVDIDPPLDFLTEARVRLLPIPYSIRSFKLPDLFAGKISAILGRQRVANIKGRDWYDLVWLHARSTPVRLAHLKARLVQNDIWPESKDLTHGILIDLLNQSIGETDFAAARADVQRFVHDPQALALWSKAFFREVVGDIAVV